MNVLVIAPACSPDSSGLALRVFNWIQMIKDEARVSYFSTYQQKNPCLTPHFYFREFGDDWKSKVTKLWTYYKTDFSGVPPLPKPDIVQIHTPYFFGLKKLFPNIPTILVEHDVNWNLLKYDLSHGPGVKKIPFQFPIIPWLHWRAKAYEKKALKESDHVFVCSPVDREEILKELPGLDEKITVIPNSLDVTSYTPSQTQGESVLFMGSLSYSANRDAAKIICEELAPRLPHIPFQILGSGTYPGPHPSNVRFLGHVKDIKPYVTNCRVFIVPLRFGSGTRWKILEAFAMQRPVLSTSKGAEGLVTTHEKNIWIENDWPSFTEAIEKLWNHPELARTLAKNGRELVATQYHHKIYAQKVMQIYQELLS